MERYSFRRMKATYLPNNLKLQFQHENYLSHHEITSWKGIPKGNYINSSVHLLVKRRIDSFRRHSFFITMNTNADVIKYWSNLHHLNFLLECQQVLKTHSPPKSWTCIILLIFSSPDCNTKAGSLQRYCKQCNILSPNTKPGSIQR